MKKIKKFIKEKKQSLADTRDTLTLILILGIICYGANYVSIKEAKLSKSELLLKKMKENPLIFKDCNINSEKKTVIQYFETQLAQMMYWPVFINTKYVDPVFSGHGDVDKINLRDSGFGLNISQCLKIFDYIKDKTTYDDIFHRDMLNEADTVIVLNYIDKKVNSLISTMK